MVGKHLCMGRVKEAALFSKVEKNCGMHMDMHQDIEDCCDDEWSLEKIEDDQQISASNKAPKADYHLLYEVPFMELVTLIISQEDDVEHQINGPPDRSTPDRYILFQNIKIPAALQS